jgi:hypothetical protein
MAGILVWKEVGGGQLHTAVDGRSPMSRNALASGFRVLLVIGHWSLAKPLIGVWRVFVCILIEIAYIRRISLARKEKGRIAPRRARHLAVRQPGRAGCYLIRCARGRKPDKIVVQKVM